MDASHRPTVVMDCGSGFSKIGFGGNAEVQQTNPIEPHDHSHQIQPKKQPKLAAMATVSGRIGGLEPTCTPC